MRERETVTLREGGGRGESSSSSSEDNNDEFDIDQEEDEGLMLNYEDESDQLLIDGAGQETIEVIQDIERMAE